MPGQFERTETLGICEGDGLVSARYQGTTVIDLDFHGLPLFRPREPLEPGTGANAGRLTQTARDAFRALSQVRGSPGRLSPTGPDGPLVAGGQGVAG